jgi:hypothetical protein
VREPCGTVDLTGVGRPVKAAPRGRPLALPSYRFEILSLPSRTSRVALRVSKTRGAVATTRA